MFLLELIVRIANIQINYFTRKNNTKRLHHIIDEDRKQKKNVVLREKLMNVIKAKEKKVEVELPKIDISYIKKLISMKHKIRLVELNTQKQQMMIVKYIKLLGDVRDVQRI